MCINLGGMCFVEGIHYSNVNGQSQLLFTRQMFSGVTLRHFGWWWHKLGPVAILILTLLKFLPFIEYSRASIVNSHMLIRLQVA